MINEIDIIRESWDFQRVLFSDEYLDSQKFIKENYDLREYTYPSGMKCDTWTIPSKWNVKKARLLDKNGNVIVDVKNHPIHLWAYSISFKGKVTKDELMRHILFREDFPDAIVWKFTWQYRPWERDWGFSIPYDTVKTLTDDEYYVDIDTELIEGNLPVLEYEAKGESDDTIFLCGHWDHPNMCNDSLSGYSVGIKVIDELRKRENLKYTYKMLIVPEIIGSIAYLQNSISNPDNNKGVICLNYLSRNNKVFLANSMFNSSKLDRIFEHVLITQKKDHQVFSFRDIGTGDEGPFEAPPHKIPTISLIREVPKEYHTQFDNFDNVNETSLIEIRKILLDAIDVLETDWIPQNKFIGMPCLSDPSIDLYFEPPKRSHMQVESNYNLSEYGPMDKDVDLYRFVAKITNLVDGSFLVFQIADYFGLPFSFVNKYLLKWVDKGLLEQKFCPTDNMSYSKKIQI